MDSQIDLITSHPFVTKCVSGSSRWLSEEQQAVAPFLLCASLVTKSVCRRAHWSEPINLLSAHRTKDQE